MPKKVRELKQLLGKAGFNTHGETYEEAFQNAQAVLELLIEDYQAREEALPEPRAFPAQTPHVA
jgi:predicted RNase H-like HicB family nuclease